MPLTHADGATGEIRVGGRAAGGLADWALRPDGPGRWVIRARLVEPVEVYLAGGRPVEARLHIGKRIWRWRGAAVAERAAGGVVLSVEGDFEQL